jgi:hypothetical protein
MAAADVLIALAAVAAASVLAGGVTAAVCALPAMLQLLL